MAGADTLANTLMTSLLTGEVLPKLDNPDLSLPQFTVVGLPGPGPTPLTNADLTTGAVGGTGVFDVLMSSVSAQLMGEFQAGRINGAQYSGAYVAAIEAVMPSAVQFLLGRDQAYWQALLTQQQAIAAQAEAVKALVDLETAKAQYAIAIFQSYTAEAEFALNKLRLANESIAYDTANYNLSNMLPAQLAQVEAQTSIANYQLASLLPAQLANMLAQTSQINYQVQNILPEQLKLVTEQTNSQKAQTSDTRSSDAAPVTGLIGQQKLLYAQQVTSYKRNAEVSAAKLFTDAFNTQVTVDSGTVPPTNFSDATLDLVLSSIRLNNHLDGSTTA